MDIEFEKDGAKKVTHEKFTEDLVAIGWKVVKPKAKKAPAKKSTAKKEE